MKDIEAEPYDLVHSCYLQYQETGLTRFVTFHQSYCYEEFIEGIRPIMIQDDFEKLRSSGQYEVRDGIFKDFCNKAVLPISKKGAQDLPFNQSPVVWKVSLQGSGNNPIRSQCLEKGEIRIGYGDEKDHTSDEDFSTHNGSKVMNAFFNRMNIGDIVFSCYSNTLIDAIGVITGEAEWHEDYQSYKHARKVKWLAENLAEDITSLNGGKTMVQQTIYRMDISAGDAIQLLRKLNPALFEDKRGVNRVFIIDEINRGNISKIFGELITLVEPGKRIGAKEEIRLKLPYSGHLFGVPGNVCIIGTMNTADRSLAFLDAALRRRFKFVPYYPDTKVLTNKIIDGIELQRMLAAINRRITVLYDREHTLGHAYFLGVQSIGDLADVFRNQIIPLLEEYFFDEPEKMALIFGKAKFFKEHDIDEFLKESNSIINSMPLILNEAALLDSENYKKIYETKVANEN